MQTSFLWLTPLVLLFSQLSYANGKPPIQIIAYQANMESEPQQIKALGNLQANQSINIASNVTDTIEKILFKAGDLVTKGQLLVELNNKQELARLQEIKVLEQETYAQYQRVKKALKSNTVTKSVVDEKYRDWQTAIAQRQEQEAILANYQIKAPFSGQLGFTPYSVGAILPAQTKIVSLDDTSQMRLDLFVPIKYLEFLSPGLEVSIQSDAFPNRTFSGKISAISPRLESSVRLIQVQAQIPNKNGLLRSNMVVNANIDLPNKTHLMVPNTAILMLGDYEFVYRLKPSKDGLYSAEKLEVQTGEVGADKTEILSGLNAGDIVVSQGVMRVNSKSPIKIKAMQNNKNQAELLAPTRPGKTDLKKAQGQ
ncbi:efflux RND transporter periplasmic adaptor subunit [Thiomicrorhabdus sp.]|uniref:efflux RND transporter periplasmic adaptor subunit n=1 Tax=Thiomicrorhabdus sp. TaxID=2039724 RepID=UPI002AA73CCC|nr:efflux RND transporter periplasmic adaptor subunit [Thiomicrorhabdus sp.]